VRDLSTIDSKELLRETLRRIGSAVTKQVLYVVTRFNSLNSISQLNGLR